MKKLFVVVILALLLAGLVLFGLIDTAISVADTSIPDNEGVGSISKTGNSSASTTITITMYAVADK